MSQQKNKFTEIKNYFEQLIILNISKREKRLTELKNHKLLTDEQLILLENMLKADEGTGFVTTIQNVSSDIIEKASNQTPQFFENQQIGIYQIIKPLGQGGMGSVYLAKRNDGTFKQTVAVKLPHSSFNPQMLQRFENERQILAQLSHNNIARLLDGGATENNQPYLVMEYIEGKDIDACCIKKQATLKQRIDLIIQTCAAVSYAHQKLILHRDLKPSNILVTESGQVKLLDFGIAKLLDDGNDNNTATQIMTRNYASPEQIQGKVVGTQSDLFSLAIIAYEIITGYHPFKADNPHEREQNLVSGTISKITKRASEKPQFPELATIPTTKIKGDLENILLKALASKPDDRYQSVKDFAEDLSNFCDNKPVNARKASFFYKFSKLVQRHKIATFAIVLSLATLVGSSIFSYQKAQEAENKQKVAEQEMQKANEISKILQNLFIQAQPAKGKNEVMAKDLLDEGIAQIKNNSDIDTNNKYSLLLIIFRSYALLGKIQTLKDKMTGVYSNCVKDLSEFNKNCQNILIYKAYTQHRLGNDEMAVKYHLQAENIAKKEQPINEDMYFKILSNEFGPLYNTQQYNLAIKKLEQALTMLKNSPEPSLLSINALLNNLIIGALQAGNIKLAKTYLDERFDILKELGLEDDEEMASYQSSMSHYYQIKHQPKMALHHIELAIEIFDKLYKTETQLLSAYLEKKAKLLIRTGDFKSSLFVFNKIINGLEKYGNGQEFKLPEFV